MTIRSIYAIKNGWPFWSKSFEYDDQGRVIQEIMDTNVEGIPLYRETQLAYADGLLQKEVQRETYTYSAHSSESVEKTIHYEYDENRNLINQTVSLR